MNGAVQQEPAYVIHRRPWRESSLLVDLFTLNHGRISLIARGASGPRSPLKAQLQPFQPLLVDWRGRSDLKTLIQLEVRQAAALHQTRSLYSGLYLNELLQRVLPVADSHPMLFAAPTMPEGYQYNWRKALGGSRQRAGPAAAIH